MDEYSTSTVPTAAPRFGLHLPFMIVGLQPELLADAFQPRGGGSAGSPEAHHAGDSRLRFLFLAPKIFRHAGRVGVSYSDHYESPLRPSDWGQPTVAIAFE